MSLFFICIFPIQFWIFINIFNFICNSLSLSLSVMKKKKLFGLWWYAGEKKLAKVIVPDKWKEGASNTTEGGGRKINENKLLSKKKRFFLFTTINFILFYMSFSSFYANSLYNEFSSLLLLFFFFVWLPFLINKNGQLNKFGFFILLQLFPAPDCSLYNWVWGPNLKKQQC